MALAEHVQRTIVGRLSRFLASPDIGPNDHIEFQAHLIDGGRTVEWVRITAQQLTPEGAMRKENGR